MTLSWCIANAVSFGVSFPIRSLRAVLSRCLSLLGAGLLSLPVQAQVAAPSPDTARRDPTRAQPLAAIRVDVTRAASTADHVPWAVGSQDARELRRGQATLGVDEALGNIPGVVVSNRYNYSLDQRVSIRGAGSRANFGLRGVKVLLDGIPQSLPDGQSQLTNVDLAAISRVEVLRGSASSLYGNGSGGVISFTSDLSAPERLGASVRVTGGSFGLAKTQLRASGRVGGTVGAVSASRTTLDGFRQYSAADTRQLSGAVDHAFSDRLSLAFRAGEAETPLALNPGALTAAEYALNPDTAAPNNVRRGAMRQVSQRYLSMRLRGTRDDGAWSASVYGQRRFVDNPLATAPPAPAGPTNGTLSTLDRRVVGARLDASRSLAAAWRPRVTGGFDVQRSHDTRRNQRSTGGRIVVATDTLLLDQAETVTSVGPFAQVQFDPSTRVTVSLGARYDRLSFRVDDHFTGDGDDDSAERAMSAASGHVGLVWRVASSFVPYANIATAFETPTTTELLARSDGLGGFNDELGPQRVRTVEVGARGRVGGLAGGRVGYEVSLFESDAREAIVQYLETAGRAYFRNAGRTRSRGVELGVTASPTRWLELRGAWTIADYRFVTYRVPSATIPPPAQDTLDGNRLAGVPGHSWRLGARGSWGGFALDLDHTKQSALWGNDANTVRVADWGRGQLNARASWSGGVRGWRLEPFVALQNAFDERYVGAVTLNGFGGRVLEPAPGRNWYLGLELGAPILR